MLLRKKTKLKCCQESPLVVYGPRTFFLLSYWDSQAVFRGSIRPSCAGLGRTYFQTSPGLFSNYHSRSKC